MSEIIRKLAGVTPTPAEFAGYTTKRLAELCHEAEDTDNDLLLLDVQAELRIREERIPGTERLFMDWYRRLWVEREKNSK